MPLSDRHARRLAVGLSMLAGYVDALGFLDLGGFFVSFMSGNSTRAGVGLVRGTAATALATGLVAAVGRGAVLGSLAGRATRRRRPTVLALVAVLLAAAAGLGSCALPRAAALAMALAMGAANTVFEREGEVRLGVTYMTGTLVKLGQRIAGALLGGDPLAWVPYFLLWAGLVAGSTLGAAVWQYLGLRGLWIAVAAAAALGVVAWRVGELHGGD